MSQPTVAAIVPAYNEEATVGDVVRALVSSGAFREVIVVSDGSTDGTALAAHDAGATLVHAFAKNRGKGEALASGLSHTDAPVVCFFDADLLGLTQAHIAALLDPVLTGEHVMTIGVRDRGALTDAFARMFKIGGQRALRREIFARVPPACKQGYKIEPALNFVCAVQRASYEVVTLNGLRFKRKIEKVGVLAGILGYARMSLQIISAMVQCQFARQQFITGEGSHAQH